MEIFLKVKATSNIKRLKVLNNHDLLAFQVIWLGCFKFQQFLAPEMGVKQPVLEVIYMILGIGADDVFILYDAWLQSAHVEGVKVQLLFGVGGCEFPWIQKPRSFANILGKYSFLVLIGCYCCTKHIFSSHFPYPATWNFLRQTQLKYRFTWAYRKSAMAMPLGSTKSNATCCQGGEIKCCERWIVNVYLFGEYQLSGGHFGWKKTHMVRWSLNKGAVWGRVSHLHRERWGEVWHCSNCEIWHSIKCLYQGSLVVVVTNGCCSW